MNPRIWQGFVWGVVATIAMTVVHIFALVIIPRLMGVTAIPMPMPEVIVLKIFGPGLPTAILLLLAVVFHLGYGGFWGAFLFASIPRVTVAKGVVLGAFLYLILLLFLRPLLGQGAFGTPVPLRLALGSAATHFTYGATLGWFGGRKRLAAAAA